MNIKTRFSKVINEYEKYRPGYPIKVIENLKKIGLNNDSIIAGIGSGTGIFSKQIIDECKFLYSVEPNNEMRQICEEKLKNSKNYSSIDATAENTTLKAKSIEPLSKLN